MNRSILMIIIISYSTTFGCKQNRQPKEIASLKLQKEECLDEVRKLDAEIVSLRDQLAKKDQRMKEWFEAVNNASADSRIGFEQMAADKVRLILELESCKLQLRNAGINN